MLLSLVLCLSLPVSEALPTQSGDAAKNGPTFQIGRPAAGAKEIAGLVSVVLKPDGAKEAPPLPTQVLVTVASGSGAAGSLRHTSVEPLTIVADGATRQFRFVAVVPALERGDSVKVCALDASRAQLGCADVVPVWAPFPFQLKVPLSEGAHVVSGVAPVAVGPDNKPISVEVVVRRGALDTVFAQRVVTTDVKADRSFAAALPAPLVAGQYVHACAYSSAGSELACTRQLVEAAGDMGRVRYYFAGGVVFSKERNDFSQQDLALSFTLDKTWMGHEPCEVDKHAPATDSSVNRLPPGCKADPSVENDQAQKRFANGANMNTLFDVRLTSVAVQTTSTTPGSGGTPAITDHFLASQKAAVVQAGWYVSTYRQSWTWTHRDTRQAVFFVPIVLRAGVQTTIGTNSGDSSTKTTAATTATTTTSSASGVYKFYSVGFGVGQEALPGTPNSAPEILSYLNISLGQWQNFGFGHGRIVIDGRLKLPETPLQIGIDVNLPFSRDVNAPADVRFTIGARFEIGDLLGKLKLLGS